MTGHEEAIARIARAEVRDVLAAATDLARERATARLADLLTDALVAEALATRSAPTAGTTAGTTATNAGTTATNAETTAPTAAGTTRPAAAPVPSGDTVLYAYAITGADLRLDSDSDSDVPVQVVADADLGLLVSPVAPADLQVDADDLSETGRLAVLARRHDSVVRAAVAQGPALPLRFGTAVPDEAAARRLLREHAEPARRQLDRLGDAREWGVRLVRSLAEPALSAPAPDHGEGLSGTEYLARRRQALHLSEAADRQAGAAADRLTDALGRYATESLRRGGSTGSSLLLDVAFLVRPGDEAAFTAAAERLAGDLAHEELELEITGPWPPYSFAALSLEALSPEVPDAR